MPETKKDTGLKIRIRLKSYDHRVIDQSAKQIVDTAIRTGANDSLQNLSLPAGVDAEIRM